jgi:predicted RNA-binding protein with RPS1 domain
MEFLKTKSKYTQYVAIGSNQGFLHILEVPRNLVKPIPDENLHIQSFFNREEEKVRYFERRFEYHKQNSVELNQERNLEKMFKDIIMRDPASLLDY